MRKAVDHAVGGNTIRYPRRGVDRTGFHQFDDAAVLSGSAIAGGEEGDLFPMEVGVVEGDVADEEADKDELATVGDKAEGGLHGLRVARAVEYERGGGGVVRPFMAGLQRVVRLGEGAAFGTEVHQFNLGARNPQELDHRQTNRSGSDDDRALAADRLAAQYGVRADAQRLHQRQLRRGEFRIGIEVRCGYQEALAHAAVNVNAEHLEGLAAVRLAAPAGLTGATVEIGIHGATVANVDACGALAQRDYLNGEFMPEDPGIAEERLTAAVSVQIGTADSDAEDADESLAGGGHRGFRRVVPGELARLFKNQVAHREQFTGSGVHSREVREHDTVSYLERRVVHRPRVGVILGSGLGAFADTLENRLEIPYCDIPNWPVSTVAGHSGKLVFGELSGVRAVVMSGRNHLYEGYTATQVVLGVRAMAALGIQALVVTNAAGGINLAYNRGALVLISDHINLQGENPLIGPNDDSLGPRFPDMTEAYSARFRTIAHQAAGELGFTMHEGVYAGLRGPNYETPAEIRYLRTIGADLVGMSTVAEVIAANHMNLPVLAISCVTNMAAGVTKEKINHEEVMETGRQVHERFVKLLKNVVPKLVPA
jgi:purine-nucleoside phosphorylase